MFFYHTAQALIFIWFQFILFLITAHLSRHATVLCSLAVRYCSVSSWHLFWKKNQFSRYLYPFAGVFLRRVSVQTVELVHDEARCVGGDSVVLSDTSLLRLRTLWNSDRSAAMAGRLRVGPRGSPLVCSCCVGEVSQSLKVRALLGSIANTRVDAYWEFCAKE